MKEGSSGVCVSTTPTTPSQVPQPTCYWKWVGVTMPLKAGNFSLQPSRTENSGRAWPVGCLLDFWTSHEDTCTISFLSTHWFCRQHSSSILLQIATFAGGRYFTWISHFQLSYFSPVAVLDLWTGWISPFLTTCLCYRESTRVVYFFENLSWWLKAQGLKLIWWKINIHNILKLQDNGHSSSCAHKSGAISSQLGLRTFQAAPAMVQSFSTCQSFKIYKPLFTGCGCASRPACKKNLALLH